jgi:LacI family transcriptional regulator
MAVTLKEIAKQAGVAKSTASRIINNKVYDVTPEVKERVLAACRELDYRPNFFARSLKMGKTKCIGLMGSMTMMNFNFPYFSDITASVEAAMGKLDTAYSLIVFGQHNESAQEMIQEMLKKGMADGLLLTILAQGMERFEDEVVPVLNSYNIPFVVMHSLNREFNFNNVGIDSSLRGYLPAEYLLAKGYDDIAYYALWENNIYTTESINGFKKAYSDQGKAWDHRRLIRHDMKGDTHTIAEDAYNTMMAVKDIPQALFVQHEDAAQGVLEALKVRNHQRVEVVGSYSAKPVPQCEYLFPAVCHPVKEKAEQAVTMLVEILDGKRSRDTVYNETVKPYLVERKRFGNIN